MMVLLQSNVVKSGGMDDEGVVPANTKINLGPSIKTVSEIRKSTPKKLHKKKSFPPTSLHTIFSPPLAPSLQR